MQPVGRGGTRPCYSPITRRYMLATGPSIRELGLCRPSVAWTRFPMPGITTLYTRWGNWVPLAALALWAGLLLTGGRSRRPAAEITEGHTPVVQEPVRT